MKKLLFVTLAAAGLAGGALAQGAGDYPPDADPGSCYARVLIPETTEVVTEQVLDTPERTELTLIPATFETVTEQVLVKEQAISYSVEPAVFETVTDQIVEMPEHTESVVIPAEYDTYTEQVLVRPSYSTWKPGAGLFGRNAAAGTAETASVVATGDLLCRVEIPAQYDTVTRTRLVRPEKTETRIIPATYRTITKQVVVTPARVVETLIPAEYETVTVQKMVTPAQEQTVVIPATYRTIEKRVVTGGGGLEWREVLCDTNAPPAKIAQVQAALTAKGYEVPADGNFGPATLTAMENYQRANGLPVGYLTISTVESLGVPVD
ncbi:peptidoglycan-binding domain-containing protein [Hyphomonas johnsonii]|uniref:Peptidoglycan-binding protein n=1 Tax=Hyphomonas johnsonii MHS-2 TaxID=1280950 RepID=A0A059FUX4_9PROT|nr:peptidoglycan-binding protein [Hyphomonas johnsonii]KCZ94316.1 peptidoglycan-binding protein [Hyphomonas johnsonii MHS-2]